MMMMVMTMVMIMIIIILIIMTIIITIIHLFPTLHICSVHTYLGHSVEYIDAGLYSGHYIDKSRPTWEITRS